MTEFAIGSRVRFIRGNSNGGSRYGNEGEEVTVDGSTIHLDGTHRQVWVRFDSNRHEFPGGIVFAHIKDLEPVGPRVRKLSGFGQFMKRLDSEDRVQP